MKNYKAEAPKECCGNCNYSWEFTYSLCCFHGKSCRDDLQAMDYADSNEYYNLEDELDNSGRNLYGHKHGICDNYEPRDSK